MRLGSRVGPPMRTLLALSLTLAALGLACAEAPTSQSTSEPDAPASETLVEHRPELAAPITEAGYAGAFVLLDPASERLLVSDPELAERRFIPASTFKIPNSLIALETGVADSPGFTLAWDGVERWAPSWNRDHDMVSAFAESAVWYYQELARRIGEARMAAWLRDLDYGNADISGGIDTFWLNGGLRISAREQVEFLRRLHEGATPLSASTVERFLSEVMIHERRPQQTVRAKTGWAKAEDFASKQAAGFESDLGWFVGSVEDAGGGRVYFAIVLLGPEPTPDGFREDRKRLAYALLTELGWL